MTEDGGGVLKCPILRDVIYEWPLNRFRDGTEGRNQSGDYNKNHKAWVRFTKFAACYAAYQAGKSRRQPKQAMITLRGMAEHRFSNYYQCLTLVLYSYTCVR